MRDLRVCAACLATDVRMFTMSAASLLQPYQLLSGRQIRNNMPRKLCWECAALVHKFSLFRHKCERAYLLLQDIYNQYDEITEDSITKVDRDKHELSSQLAIIKVHTSVLRCRTKKSLKTQDIVAKQTQIETQDPEVKFENVLVDEIDKLKFEVELKPDIESVKVEDVPFVDISDSFDFGDCTNFADDVGENQKVVEGKQKDRVFANGHKRKKSRVCRTSKDFKATEVLLTPEEAKKIYTRRQKSSKYKKAKFRCMLCYRFYKDSKSYEKHRLKHDPARGDYECDTCRMRFSSRVAIRIHINVQHSKKYTCSLCSKTSYTREVARLHYKCHEKGRAIKKKSRKRKKKNAKVVTADEFGTAQVILTQEEMMEIVRARQFADSFNSARYKCNLCYKGFNEDKPFENHMRQHDPISGVYECDICKIRYKTRRKLYKHISCNHMKKYTCKTCSNVCYNRASAQKHYAWHKGVVYTCHICGATSVRMSTHLSHLRIKHPSQHICGECGESFVSRKGLYHHHNKMHSVKAVSAPEGVGPYCADCDIQFSSTQIWTKHILISPKHELERHTIANGCQYCGETFDTDAELKRHHMTEHKRYRKTMHKTAQKQFPVKCAQCEETMSSAGKYWQHFRQQHPGKPFPLTRSSFICEYCGNWFKHKSALDVHAQTHSEKRTHQCSKCPKRFVKLVSLAAHAECHADSGQFGCDVCNRQFAYKHALTNHFRTHTVEKPHVCEWCGKTFAYDCNLKKHELTVHCSAPAPSSSHHM